LSGFDAITTRLIALAVEEDLAAGDATAAATIPAAHSGAARFVARREGVSAGVGTIAAVAHAVDAALVVRPLVDDGAVLAPHTALAEIAGPTRSILAAERTALNLLTHLCGVATQTAHFVAAVAGTGCVVRDTRKTLPGLRALAKAAVAAGGGTNHRFNLGDGLLVKDNHVAASGGVAAATSRALAHAGGLPVQVEVDTLEQLDEALAAGAAAVLLDNFDLPGLVRAVSRCRAHTAAVFAEASGNVTLETVRAIAETGVDAVAVGALTHSVRALDIGLDWDPDVDAGEGVRDAARG
jgi:nicotinate-nucleotide pyrophosphorylase (carboxylating)